MTLVAERQVPEAEPGPPTTPFSPSPTTRSEPLELLTRYAWRQGVFGALAFAIRVLSARAILLFAVIGAIALAYLALTEVDPLRLAVVGTYLAGVVGPLVWLASRG